MSIQIEKVPLNDTNRPIDYPAKFPSIPILYLELLENKDKIKQDLINVDYVPKNTADDKEYEVKERKYLGEEVREIGRRHEEERYSEEKYDEEKSYRGKHSRGESEYRHRDRERDRESEREYRHRESDRESEREYRHRDRESEREYRHRDRESEREYRERDRESEDSHRPTHKERESRSRESNLSNRLRELLGDSGSEKSVKIVQPEVRKEYFKAEPPSLNQLRKDGVYVQKDVLRDIGQVTRIERDEDDQKRHLLFKFEQMKMMNPQIEVPEYTIHTDLTEMQKTYDMQLRRVSIDRNVSEYKSYMLFGFLITEWCFGNLLGFDMQGFTQHQQMNMQRYDHLLIELGEKSYIPTGSSWPVELRLIGVIILQACFFLMTKMVLRKTGVNMSNLMNVKAPVKEQPQQPAKKHKMRAPEPLNEE
jgi:hypothetical protein